MCLDSKLIQCPRNICLGVSLSLYLSLSLSLSIYLSIYLSLSLFLSFSPSLSPSLSLSFFLSLSLSLSLSLHLSSAFPLTHLLAVTYLFSTKLVIMLSKDNGQFLISSIGLTTTHCVEKHHKVNEGDVPTTLFFSLKNRTQENKVHLTQRSTVLRVHRQFRLKTSGRAQI